MTPEQRAEIKEKIDAHVRTREGKRRQQPRPPGSKERKTKARKT